MRRWLTHGPRFFSSPAMCGALFISSPLGMTVIGTQEASQTRSLMSADWGAPEEHAQNMIDNISNGISTLQDQISSALPFPASLLPAASTSCLMRSSVGRRAELSATWLATYCSLVLFFFQAEDGIRALIVTGVQTCALPISRQIRRAVAQRHGRRQRGAGAFAGR